PKAEAPAAKVEGVTREATPQGNLSMSLSTPPPTLLHDGAEDRPSEQAGPFMAGAKEEGARVELCTAEGMRHGSSDRPPWTAPARGARAPVRRIPGRARRGPGPADDRDAVRARSSRLPAGPASIALRRREAPGSPGPSRDAGGEGRSGRGDQT